MKIPFLIATLLIGLAALASRSPSSVITELNQYDGIRKCYLFSVAGQKHKAGSVVLSFDLSEKGKVNIVKVVSEKSTLDDPGLNACMIQAVKGLNYSTVTKGMEKKVDVAITFPKE